MNWVGGSWEPTCGSAGTGAFETERRRVRRGLSLGATAYRHEVLGVNEGLEIGERCIRRDQQHQGIRTWWGEELELLHIELG